MLKAHKYWSIGAFSCMTMAMISGHEMKSKKAHCYWALGAFGCMAMSVYTGYQMTHRKPKKPAEEIQENKENEGERQDG